MIYLLNWAYSDVLFLKDGISCNVNIQDTAGCSIQYIRNGSEISLAKAQIKKIVFGKDTIDYSSFVCSEPFRNPNKKNESNKNQLNQTAPRITGDTFKELQTKKDINGFRDMARLGCILHFSCYGAYLGSAVLYAGANQKWVIPFIIPTMSVLFVTGPIVSCLAEYNARSSYPDLFPSNTKTGVQYYKEGWMYLGVSLGCFGLTALCINSHAIIPAYFLMIPTAGTAVASLATSGLACITSCHTINKMEKNEEYRLHYSLSPIIGKKTTGLCLNVNFH